jgi:hypothetical protein
MRLDSIKLYNYNFIPKVEEEVALYSTRMRDGDSFCEGGSFHKTDTPPEL